jgi:beta-galactosidase
MKMKKILSLVLCMTLFSCCWMGFGGKSSAVEGEHPSGGYKVEAEAADSVTDQSDKLISPIILEDSAASGGKAMGSTNGKGYIFKDVPQSNSITMRYASTNTSSVSVFIEKNGSFERLGSIQFSTTQSWEFKKAWNAVSEVLFIPEGSTIKLVPDADVNLDYFIFHSSPLYTEKDLSEAVCLAYQAELENCGEVDDIYSYTGKAVQMKKGSKVSFSIPEGLKCNVINIRGSGKNLIVKVISENGEGSVSFDTEVGDYKMYGVLIPASEAPGKITIALDSSSPDESIFHLDAVTMNAKSEADVVTVRSGADTPENGGRSEILLDGIWECDASVYMTRKELPDSVPEDLTFNNAICVPGLWDLADLSMGDYKDKAFWYKKTVIFEEAPDYQVILKIDRAYYGRYIFVNGTFVEEYEYNYTNSFTDISEYLVQGENEIVIMLGNSTQQRSDSSCKGHVLSDSEKEYEYPGIVDHVSLILNQSPWVHSVQVAPDLQNGSVALQPMIKNNSDIVVEAAVEYRVYAIGVLKNGALQQERTLVGTARTERQAFVSGEDTVLNEVVTIEDFNDSMLWTVDSPYLFEIEVDTGSDVLVKRFGMRTFCFDSETKLPLLNGTVTYLRGTNVVINRFFEDPNRAQHPWEKEWIRAFYAECKDTNWNSLRFHLGSAPSDWYDIADEVGFLISDEYAWFSGCRDSCTERTIRPEIHAWIEEKNTHPSIIIWDMQNEDIASTTNSFVKKNRDYDIQNRPWDNGWSKPLSETDPFECHPYLLCAGFEFDQLNEFSTSYENPTSIIPEGFAPLNPKILNEYGSIWLNREGNATTAGMQAYYDQIQRDNTAEDRIRIYADAVGRITEFWRSGRHFAGIQQFCALTYSKPTGEAVTGDILMPDLSTPKFRPEIKEKFRNAFAPLGISINEWSEVCERGTDRTIPVTLVNDYNDVVDNLIVTLKIYKENSNRAVKKYTKNVSLKAAGDEKGGDRQEIHFDISLPGSRTDKFRVVAEYEFNGETVRSERVWTIVGGDITELPGWAIASICAGGAAVIAVVVIIIAKSRKKRAAKD